MNDNNAMPIAQQQQMIARNQGLLDVITRQRNEALDAAANNFAELQGQLHRGAQLELWVRELTEKLRKLEPDTPDLLPPIAPPAAAT